MRGHKTRRAANGINIPCPADIQARAAGRNQSPFHDVTSAVRRLFRLHDFILSRMTKQRVRQFLPFGHRKPKRRKNHALLPPAGCPGLSK